MKSKPYFSIIIPSLNEEKYLPALLKDLVTQTNQDFEVIVVDGHSNDKTVIKAKLFLPKLSLTILNSPVRNVCTQRNAGAAKAKALWLLFLDADNRLPPYFIQGLRYQIDKTHARVFTTFLNFDSHHPLDKTFAQITNTFFLTQQNVSQPSLLEACIGVEKILFQKIGGFNQTVKWGEGTVLFSQLVLNKIKPVVFKDPVYTCSLRRLRKEGTLNTIRNVSPLILARLTGINLDPKLTQKLYPMLGGSLFNKPAKQSSLLEKIIIDLIKKYHVLETIDKLNQPITLPKNSFTKFLSQISRQ